MRPHEQAHQDAARADGWDQHRADEGAPPGGRIRFGGEHRLGVGLGRENAQDEGERGAPVLADSPGEKAAEADGGRVIDPVHRLQKTAHAAGKHQHHDAAADHGKVEESQLQDAHHTGAVGPAEHHVQGHEGGGDQQGRNKAETRRGNGDHGSSGDQLGNHVDKRAHAAEQGRSQSRPRAELLGQDPDERLTPGAPPGADEAQGEYQAGQPSAQGKPPCRHAIMVSQLGCAHGGGTAHQRTHNDPGDDGSPVGSRGGFPARSGEHSQKRDAEDRGQETGQLCGGKNHVKHLDSEKDKDWGLPTEAPFK